MRCSTNWAMKPHIRSEVNLLTSYLPVQWNDVKFIWNNWYLYCSCRGHRFESCWSPDFFHASSFQLLKLENLLWRSLFTFIYNCSTNMRDVWAGISILWWGVRRGPSLKVYEAMSKITTVSDIKEVEPLTFRLTSNWRRQQKAKRCCAKEKLMKPAKLFVALSHQMPVKSY